MQQVVFQRRIPISGTLLGWEVYLFTRRRALTCTLNYWSAADSTMKQIECLHSYVSFFRWVFSLWSPGAT